MTVRTASVTDTEKVISMSSQTVGEDVSLTAEILAQSAGYEDRIDIARTVVFNMVSGYWKALQAGSARSWPIRKLPAGIKIIPLPAETAELARITGTAAARLDIDEASYMIGVIYTGLLPDRVRSQLGAYYTPPTLCERLLDMAANAGMDWSSARVLDPACGGGAFISPVARRMAESLKNRNATDVLNHIQQCLWGFELDPFAAWMSQVYLDATLRELYHEAGKRLQSVVRVCDSLEQSPENKGFDLVVGNPPYGRVTLSTALREKYRRSLFGHANLYGIFTDLALHYTRMGGVVAYVTPTSFLAGEYFKALRGLLGREAPPKSIDFIGKRKGVFSGVLQETLLAVYQRGGDADSGKVHFISPSANGSIKIMDAGPFNLPDKPDQPWLMPRTEKQSKLLQHVKELPYRLSDYGYAVSTGPLVWNRHKPSLKTEPGEGRYPLIWAEAVRPDGVFEFRAKKRNHKPYFEPKPKENWVVTDFPCVLLQRTTAKEQFRRLIAAELPVEFIEKHGAVVVENHLNMIKPLNGVPSVSPAVLAALLNSEVVDQVFRCINGSVAVSAYELEALPLPPPEEMPEIERLVQRHAERETLEQAVERLYANGG